MQRKKVKRSGVSSLVVENLLSPVVFEGRCCLCVCHSKDQRLVFDPRNVKEIPFQESGMCHFDPPSSRPFNVHAWRRIMGRKSSQVKGMKMINVSIHLKRESEHVLLYVNK